MNVFFSCHYFLLLQIHSFNHWINNSNTLSASTILSYKIMPGHHPHPDWGVCVWILALLKRVNYIWNAVNMEVFLSPLKIKTFLLHTRSIQIFWYFSYWFSCFDKANYSVMVILFRTFLYWKTKRPKKKKSRKQNIKPTPTSYKNSVKNLNKYWKSNSWYLKLSVLTWI